MKQLLQQCAAYTAWANQKIFDCIGSLPEEQVDKEIVSSFPSISKTVIHMWDAEAAWWQRVRLAEKVEIPSENFNGSFTELLAKVSQQSQVWKDWVDNATEAQLQHVFAYRNNKKEEFKQPVYEVLMHVFNHGTYHRGQLVTMLRQLDADKIPQTDFVIFCRKK